MMQFWNEFRREAEAVAAILEAAENGSVSRIRAARCAPPGVCRAIAGENWFATTDDRLLKRRKQQVLKPDQLWLAKKEKKNEPFFIHVVVPNPNGRMESSHRTAWPRRRDAFHDAIRPGP